MPIRATVDAEDPKSKKVVHATDCGDGGEFTACGLDTTEWAANGSYSVPVDNKKSITCEHCILCIEQWVNHFEKVRGRWYER